MTKQERLSLKIANKERIILSRSNPVLKAIAFLFLITNLIAAAFLSYFFRNTNEWLLIFGFIGILYILFLFHLRKYVSAYIQGEMLLSESIYKKNKITSLQSIRCISSRTIFKFNCTHLTYKLDGCTKKIIIVKRIDSEQIENEEIIKTILRTAC